AAGNDDIYRRPCPLPRGKGDPITVPDILGAQPLSIEGGSRLTMLVHHPVSALILRSSPVHLDVRATSHQVQQGRYVVGRCENGVVEVRSHPCRVVGMSVQF